MLTTFSNLAGTIAFDISTLLTLIWDVDEETLEAGEFKGVKNLSLLCTLVAPLPLLFIGLIPRNRSDQDTLLEEKDKNYWCGVAFIVIMAATMFGTFYESIHTVRHAGDIYHRG